MNDLQYFNAERENYSKVIFLRITEKSVTKLFNNNISVTDFSLWSGKEGGSKVGNKLLKNCHFFRRRTFPTTDTS